MVYGRSLWRRLSKFIIDEDYKRARNVFKYILCHPQLPKEVAEAIQESAKLSVQEQKERFDIFTFKETEVCCFPTERLEELKVIEHRERYKVKIAPEKAEGFFRHINRMGL